MSNVQAGYKVQVESLGIDTNADLNALIKGVDFRFQATIKPAAKNVTIDDFTVWNIGYVDFVSATIIRRLQGV